MIASFNFNLNDMTYHIARTPLTGGEWVGICRPDFTNTDTLAPDVGYLGDITGQICISLFSGDRLNSQFLLRGLDEKIRRGGTKDIPAIRTYF